jgi:hypothetical protein
VFDLGFSSFDGGSQIMRQQRSRVAVKALA